MTVYIDELFVLNLIINYLLLHAAAMLCGAPVRRLRFWAGAGLGALYACLTFLPELRRLTAFPAKTAVSLVMSLTAYGWQDRRAFLRRTLLFYTVSFAFGGAMLALFRLTGAPETGLRGGVLYGGISVPVLLAVSLAAWLLLTRLLRNTPRLSQRGPPRTRLTLILRGQETELDAMVDTGNRLTDPLTNEPVTIVEYDRIRQLLPRELRAVLDVCGVEDAAGTLRMLHAAGLHEGFRLLPYSAVGTARGLLLALRADRIVTEKRKLEQPLLALTRNDLTVETGCGAVIGAWE